jgi:DNA polymerase
VDESEKAIREEIKRQKRESIDSLKNSSVGCRLCELEKTRTNVVFGVGNPASPLMLIGEGPGMNEDAQGEPFVGRAGQLLDACLFEAGMKREHIYLTNILKCRASAEQDGRIVNRPPTTSELDACVPAWLLKQIEICKPLVVCCIGGPAAKVIISPGFAIMKERGRFFETKYAPYCIAALHPAFILRQDGDAHQRYRQSLVDDLRLAKERAVAAMREPSRTLF